MIQVATSKSKSHLIGKTTPRRSHSQAYPNHWMSCVRYWGQVGWETHIMAWTYTSTRSASRVWTLHVVSASTKPGGTSRSPMVSACFTSLFNALRQRNPKVSLVFHVRSVDNLHVLEARGRPKSTEIRIPNVDVQAQCCPNTIGSQVPSIDFRRRFLYVRMYVCMHVSCKYDIYLHIVCRYFGLYISKDK